MSAPYLTLEIKCNTDDSNRKTLVNVDCYENIRGRGHFRGDCDLLPANLCTSEHKQQMLRPSENEGRVLCLKPSQ